LQVGDYVLVHAGFAIQKLQEDVAKETLKLFNQYLEILNEPESGFQATEKKPKKRTRKKLTAS